MAAKEPISATSSPAEILNAANDAVLEADALAEHLEAAARNGSPEVTREMLEDAQKRASWTRVLLDGAQRRAQARKQELKEDAYAKMKADVLPVAMESRADEIDALLKKARGPLEKAIGLIGDHNAAVFKVAAHVSDDTKYRAEEDGFMGIAPSELPGAAWFEYLGVRYEYLPASKLLKDLLAPIKQDAIRASGGVDRDFLKAI